MEQPDVPLHRRNTENAWNMDKAWLSHLINDEEVGQHNNEVSLMSNTDASFSRALFTEDFEDQNGRVDDSSANSHAEQCASPTINNDPIFEMLVDQWSGWLESQNNVLPCLTIGEHHDIDDDSSAYVALASLSTRLNKAHVARTS